MNLLRPIDRNVTVQGLRFHVLDWGGEGRTPLLLLHGFTGHAHAWDTLAIALQPHFHVYALDQRGHGDSDPAEVYGPIAAFDDLSGVIDQLGLAPARGGRALHGRAERDVLHSKRPEAVRKLVIVDIGPEISTRASQAPPGPPEPEYWDSIEQAAQHLLRGNPYPGIHYYRWVAASEPAPAAGRAHRVGVAPEREDAALDGRRWTGGRSCARSRCRPWCCAARRARSSTATWRSAWPSELPQGRFVEIPRAVHTLHEDNPDAVLAALRSFLGF